MSLLGLELMDDITSRERGEFIEPAANAVNAVSSAAVDQLGPRLRSVFRELNDIQRSVAGIMFDLSLSLARTSLNMLADESGADGHEDQRIGPEYSDVHEHAQGPVHERAESQRRPGMRRSH